MARLDLPLVVPWIRLDQDAKAEEEAALRRARDPSVAGFCLFGGEAEGVRRLTARLRDAAGKKALFIASDMERGAGQQVKGLRVLPDAGVFGLAAIPDEARAFGRLTALDARSVGVDVLFAPVVDVRSELGNPIVGNRSFGYDPDRVGMLASAYVEGAFEGGALPTAKHFPGHGGTLADSHDAVPVVNDSARCVIERDLAPFLQVLHTGCPAVMTAHVAYPALDPSGAIATFSKSILDRLLSKARGPGDVVVFTDALLMSGALGGGSETEAARRALTAGCHALLIPTDPERLAAELLDGADAGLLAAAELGASALAQFGVLARGMAGGLGSRGQTDDSHPAQVAERALWLAGGGVLGPIAAGKRIVVIDDDATVDRGLVLERRGKAAGVGVVIVRLGKGQPPPRIEAGAQPSAIVVMSSVRAWKGASDLSEAGRALLSFLSEAAPQADVVRLSPRAGSFGIHVPGTGPDVEAALADRWFPSA